MTTPPSTTRVVQPLLPPRYGELERLPGGAMGVVYRATDETLKRTVAVKLLPEHYATDLESRRRFRREALAAARLSHAPNTATIYDVGEWQGRPYLVMQYLAGGSLAQRLSAEGAQPPARALAWLEQTAAALDHAHAHGIVHRDVKPANLLLDTEHVVHVADFGVASAAGLASLTATGTVVGSAGYLAPEQAEGRTATSAVDRYALAVVAFELLTGNRPYERETAAAEAAAHLNAAIPSPSDRNPQLPRRLDVVFAQALAKQPEARYASCAAFVGALAATLSEAAPTRRLAAATSATLIRPGLVAAPPWSRRLRRTLIAVLLAAAAAAGGALALALTHKAAAAAPSTLTLTAPAPPARTITRTVTTTRTITGTAAPSAQDTGNSDLNQAEALLQAGNDQAAIPLLQQAVQLLQDSGGSAEATADYTLALATIQLGSCDGVLPLLDRAETILGHQPEIDQLRATCTGPPGHRPGHGDGNGNGNGNGNG